MPSVRAALKFVVMCAIPLAVGALVLALSVDVDAKLRKRTQPASPDRPPVSRAAFPPPGVVEIRTLTGPPVVLAGSPARDGRTVEIACATCHATRTPDPSVRASADLDLFHQGLTLAHAGMSCQSCHAPPGYDALRLADGTRVPYTDVMRLCGQCHGSQMRDYTNGAHGGMSGYWDTTRGGRIRNGCLVCHDPHAPAYPKIQPARGPNDRFPPASHGEGHGHPAAREREHEEERSRR